MTEAQIYFMFSALMFISSIACLSPNIYFATAINDFSKKHLSCAWIGNHKQVWLTAAIWLQAQLYSIRGALFFGGHLELYFIYLGPLNLIFICSCKLPECPGLGREAHFSLLTKKQMISLANETHTALCLL